MHILVRVVHINQTKTLKVVLMRRDMKIGLAIVAAAIIIAVGTLISIPYFIPPPPADGLLSICVVDGDSEVNFTLGQLAMMSTLQGNSSYQNRFMNWGGGGTYIGPRLSTILETANFIIGVNDTVKVTASDGYSASYAYYNLYPNSSIYALQGDLILAYSLNGTKIPGWGDGPQTAFLPSDEAYNNTDAEQTTHPDWFFGSAGARWVRNVLTIEILSDTYLPIPKTTISTTPKGLMLIPDIDAQSPDSLMGGSSHLVAIDSVPALKLREVS